MSLNETEDFTALPGAGLTAKLGGVSAFGGNRKLVGEKAVISSEMLAKADELSSNGKTPLFFASEKELYGIIGVADTIKEDSAKAVSELQNMGIRVVMLTGDNRRTAEAVGRQVGITDIVSDVKPDGKEAVISELKKYGKTAMVGDGINDAPALTRADTGIAIGAGADVAVDAADVVLMKNDLCDVPAAIRLSRMTLRNIHENLFWAFIYNTIGIPLAAGVFIPLGLTLNPMFGAAAMSLSSFCVCMNALRLNLFKPHSTKHDKPAKGSLHSLPELNKGASADVPVKNGSAQMMTVHIEGMMCPHCENTVKTALEKLDGVEKAEVSHEKGTAVLTLDATVSKDDITKAVTDKGYTVTGIE